MRGGRLGKMKVHLNESGQPQTVGMKIKEKKTKILNKTMLYLTKHYDRKQLDNFKHFTF